ncbi:unnamed protein product [Soboliphyme baturini]|uniref:Suppressor of fused-like domain-containing protein n=1 Tax=Soboliphyme baturini TaxID=241478 RepID=A0A3P8E8D4_9BILA|nr:unnamed protein product [Soboliphyme baturini]
MFPCYFRSDLGDDVQGPLGTLEFIQIVGVFDEETKAATKWNGHRVLDLLRQHVVTGGPWLVTDIRRCQSVFELDPLANDILLHGIATDGMNLTAVNCAVCSWSIPPVVESCSMMSKLHVNDVENPYGANSYRSTSQYPNYDFSNKSEFRTFDALDIHLDIKTAVLLPWMCKGRLQHRRHFTFRLMTANGIQSMITFCPPDMPGVLVSPECPYGSKGFWLQVHVSNSLLSRMIETFLDLEELNLKVANLVLPKKYELSDFRLKFIIVP